MAGLKDVVNFSGRVNFKKYKQGILVEDTTVNNLVVTTGLQYIIGRMITPVSPAVPVPEITEMALGTSNQAVLAADVQLGFELIRSILEEDSARAVPGGSLSVNGTSLTFVGQFGAGVAGAIQEAGLFNEDDLMLCRTVFPPINKDVDDVLVVSWVLQTSYI